MSRAAGDEGDDEDAPFEVDEEPLRQWILKAYHEKREGSPSDRALLAAMRDFLSGPIGGLSAPGYWFEESPARSLTEFVDALETLRTDLTAALFDPLLHGLEGSAVRGGPGLAPNLSVYIASLAGPIAIRTGIDETVVCALLSAMLLSLARLGRERVEAIIKGSPA